ncbi:Dam family site-specific DNA-(adenine-N6)-methyltransferase [Rhodococcus sp. BUPNP1]|uniref:DNA adenine methylase n=1 Tax=Rhodococcus sp. BUPNP1 TaxID=1432786 RepID=UPI000B5AA112|nr:Dam family site-specific DNA-(adenine-N6)-methyltransferase [Rhodococcus sp. BUPNP1]OWY81598.1 DNA adenine methylase [Rhodococcus sp. BUPNP1]
MPRIIVPPIKSQGIKTKLVPFISSLVPEDLNGRWIEPFMGTGCVGFNLAKGEALLADSNPHLIAFYQSVLSGDITAPRAKQFLTEEGAKLLEIGEAHFYEIRERFNATHDPMDFLFLNRSCFNGMIRFNKKGGFNVPFCRKPNRFAQAYVTKISNQVRNISQILNHGSFEFRNQSFRDTISEAKAGDLIYCDPPYIDRHADYYNGWTHDDEIALHEALSSSPASFILSTWSHNDYRRNDYLTEIWADYPVVTKEHFYHVGGQIENRKGVTEALIHSPDLSLKSTPEMAEDSVLIDEGEDTLF